MFPTDLAIAPDDLAKAAEERGFESIFFPEHTHIPTGRKTPFPGGEPIPEEYKRTHDPLVALTAAATVTSTIKLATGICLVAQRDPIVTAKEVASVDFLSGGRFIFGVGFGWNVDEMEDHAVDPNRRRAIAREKILAMKALWTSDEGSFEGRYVKVPPSWSWPKPVNKPHPPILIGGGGTPSTFRHMAEWADGWLPNFIRGDFTSRVADMRAAFEKAGRDPASASVTVFGAPRDPERLEAFAKAGVERVVFGLPPRGADEVLPALDRRAELIARIS